MDVRAPLYQVGSLDGKSSLGLSALPLPRCLNKGLEEGMRARRPRLELGMKLAAEHEGMAGQLANRDQAAIGRQAGEDHASTGEQIAVGVVNLPAVAVPLVS